MAEACLGGSGCSGRWAVDRAVQSLIRLIGERGTLSNRTNIPTVSWYYGERGLAAVDRPTFLIWGTKDVDSPYPLEAGYTYDHLTIPERYLISFVGRTHYLPFNEESVPRLKHFAVAYFGYYLQGREEYIEYFSQDFVNQFNDLVWGVYTDD